MSLVKEESFQGLIRMFSTNVSGDIKVMYAITAIPGVGRRFANMVIKRAGVDFGKRAGELTQEEVARITEIIEKPLEHGIPVWMLNRRKDYTTGKDVHLTVNHISNTLREDLQRMRKTRRHRGIRHHLRIKVRGQRTKGTGRFSSSIGVSRKK
ncbi:Ribosomal protein S13 like protein [Aduncisulcus paluster]|uniref:Ribosomal protein S13 like protein n=1 Tax=Aduncisulcus paluster TaxID=2918883 RepID=A0ABQ5K136_9EUKA|nr:Ribosomal protein S13 like protein [Aduncisulcus paluster]|eukprot:gnl/Carplike_NY0171/228_a329_4874.p2 GENE.gnl/Carplike_NY0171/228_a329_4874~~gnl/Carplike_NY0171/228_a329_4874.p2  ORF type:complete len:153 (+),score=54.09 gnl/Carplike_NY0171/228_a329_4874:50-508(+)